MGNSAQIGVGEPSIQLTPEDAVQHILSQQGDRTKWRCRKRGYVDWKFGEVAEYMGYLDAVEYVRTMRRWYNYEEQYKGQCLLDTSYNQFITHLSPTPAPKG